MVNKSYSLLAALAVQQTMLPTNSIKSYKYQISLLIQAAVILASKNAIHPWELTDLIRSYYGLDIPLPVVRGTVQSLPADHVRIEDNGNKYFFDPRIATKFTKTGRAYTFLANRCREMTAALFFHLSSMRESTVGENEKPAIINKFHQFLFDSDITGVFGPQIHNFISTNVVRETPGFRRNLRKIRQAAIRYEGISFSPTANRLIKPKTPLIIFLGPDQLYNALDIEGLTRRSGLQDLLELVLEINKANKRSGGQLIDISYLEETRIELDLFFNTRQMPDFESRLNRLGISLYRYDIPENNYLEYLLLDQETFNRVKALRSTAFPTLDDEFCTRFLKLFSRLNFLRQGRQTARPEDSRALLLTDQQPVLQLACNTRIRFLPHNIPFAVGLNYLTEYFWIKLGKGFGPGQRSGINFDHIARTNAVLSSCYKPSPIRHYKELLSEYKNKKVTEQELLKRYYKGKDKDWNDDSSNPADFHTPNTPSMDQPDSDGGIVFYHQIVDLLLRKTWNKVGLLESELSLLRQTLDKHDQDTPLRNNEFNRLAVLNVRRRREMAAGNRNWWYCLIFLYLILLLILGIGFIVFHIQLQLVSPPLWILAVLLGITIVVASLFGLHRLPFIDKKRISNSHGRLFPVTQSLLTLQKSIPVSLGVAGIQTLIGGPDSL